MRRNGHLETTCETNDKWNPDVIFKLTGITAVTDFTGGELLSWGDGGTERKQMWVKPNERAVTHLCFPAAVRQRSSICYFTESDCTSILRWRLGVEQNWENSFSKRPGARCFPTRQIMDACKVCGIFRSSCRQLCCFQIARKPLSVLVGWDSWRVRSKTWSSKCFIFFSWRRAEFSVKVFQTEFVEKNREKQHLDAEKTSCTDNVDSNAENRVWVRLQSSPDQRSKTPWNSFRHGVSGLTSPLAPCWWSTLFTPVQSLILVHCC